MLKMVITVESIAQHGYMCDMICLSPNRSTSDADIAE